MKNGSGRNQSYVFALGIGVAAQVIALRSFSWLALTWPQSPIKNIGFVVLLLGSVWSVYLLRKSSARAAIAGLVVMALAAPLVPLFFFSKAREMLSDLSYYSVVFGKSFAAALVCYLGFWLVARLWPSRKKQPA